MTERILLKLLLSFVIWGMLSVTVKAQSPTNQWIKPQQKYLKLMVDADGIYKVTGRELQTAGWPLPIANVQNLQLLHYGDEVAIRVEDGNDGVLNSEDFLLFYGRKNDGSRDTLLYRFGDERANPYYSLFTDESAYFLTQGNSPGKRVQSSAPVTDKSDLEAYHLAEEVNSFTDQYTYNNIIGLVPYVQQSYYEPGEGRSGPYIVSDSVVSFNFSFQNRVQAADYQPVIEYRVSGRSRVYHRVATVFKGTTDTLFSRILPYGYGTYSKKLSPANIINETATLTIAAAQRVSLDWYSLTYLKATYPQKIAMNGQAQRLFHFQKPQGQSFRFMVGDISANAQIWEISNPQFPRIIADNGDRSFTDIGHGKAVYLATEKLRTVKSIVTPQFFTDIPETTNYLIITHQSLNKSATTYAAYRSSAAGGNYGTLIAETQQLYDTYNYGERNPIALRNFLAEALRVAKPGYLLLIGQGVSFPDELKSTKYLDLVPTIGYPASDALLSAGLNGFDPDIMAIPTGRLSVTKDSDVLNYLAKVKEFESEPTGEWQKKILHLSGGQSIGEISELKAMLNRIEPEVTDGLLGGEVIVRSKKAAVEVEQIDISKEVNEGVGMITFTGHGSSNVLDLNIGYCSPPQNGFSNKGKYPIMFFNGCGVGNVFYRYSPLSTDWLLTPDKGAIIVFANSFWSYSYSTEIFLKNLYQKLFDDPASVDKSIGQIQQATNQALIGGAKDPYVQTDLQQVILQGDPAIHIFPIKKPDLAVTDKSLFVTSVNESRPLAANDSIRVGIIVQNLGRFDKNITNNLSVQQNYGGTSGQSLTKRFGAVALRDTVYVTIPQSDKLTSLTVTLDAAREIDELNETNNAATLSLNWNEIGQLTAFPENVLPDHLPPALFVKVNGKLLANNDIVPRSATIDFMVEDNYSLKTNEPAKHLTALLKSCETCNFSAINLTAQPAAFATQLLANSTFTDLAAGKYTLLVNAKDAVGNTLNEPYQVDFQVVEEELPMELLLLPNPTTAYLQVRFTVTAPQNPGEATVHIYDTLGRILAENKISAVVGENNYFWETQSSPAGRYFVKVSLGDGKQSKTKAFIVR